MDQPTPGSTLHAFRLGCALLLSYAATVVSVPKGATLVRVGSTVALGCMQYTFYTAMLGTSLTRAQISNICLLSWGFFINGAEQILLSRYNVEDLRGKPEKNGGGHVGTATLLFRAVRMYFNLRRVGLRGEIAMRRRDGPRRGQLLRAKISEVLIVYLIMDAAMSGPLPEEHLFAREKQTLSRFSNLSLEDVAFRCFGTIGYWFITYVCNRLNHGCAAVLWLSLGLSQPEDWPHLNGPVSACCTVRGFWGTFWHQLFRKMVTGWGDFIPDKVLRLRRGTLLSRYTRLVLAFLTSGMIHHCMQYIYRFAAEDSFAVEKFYAMQAFGIMFEDAVQATTAQFPVSKSVRRAVGYLWVIGFLSWCTPIMSYPSMRGGDPGQMVPFSVFGYMMKS